MKSLEFYLPFLRKVLTKSGHATAEGLGRGNAGARLAQGECWRKKSLSGATDINARTQHSILLLSTRHLAGCISCCYSNATTTS